MSPHSKIIERFGGISAMSRTLSKHLGRRVPKATVQGWGRAEIIPAPWHDDILAAGQVLETPLRMSEFFEEDLRKDIPNKLKITA